MEDTKNKDDKKEKESQELKDELTEDELKGVDGGDSGGDRNHFVMYGYSKKMKEERKRRARVKSILQFKNFSYQHHGRLQEHQGLQE